MDERRATLPRVGEARANHREALLAMTARERALHALDDVDDDLGAELPARPVEDFSLQLFALGLLNRPVRVRREHHQLDERLELREPERCERHLGGFHEREGTTPPHRGAQKNTLRRSFKPRLSID